MTDGFVDTLRVFGPNIYTEDTSKSVANQFAAMPSLHFGWALMLAVGMARLTVRRRMMWMLHPAITLLAIVATGNHYWIDAAVAGVLAGVVGLLVLRSTSSAPERFSEQRALTPCRHTTESGVALAGTGVPIAGRWARVLATRRSDPGPLPIRPGDATSWRSSDPAPGTDRRALRGSIPGSSGGWRSRSRRPRCRPRRGSLDGVT